jgi:uncharacterized protein (TIGR00290 family)
VTNASLPVWVSWSSGKDSAWALHGLRSDPTYRVAGLLTTVTETFDRVSIHGVRLSLLRRQARELRLPLHVVRIPYPCPNPIYERAMAAAVAIARREGVRGIAFGDLFLEDVRRYREERLRGSGLRAVFPLWGRETSELAREIVASGMKSKIVCVDPRRLPARFAGREFDHDLLAELPPEVDPCGERGEFHTFVYAAPDFRRAIPLRRGRSVERDGFRFVDFAPGRRAPSGARTASRRAHRSTART